MSDLPRGAAGRAARLASLPLGHVGRSARGLGRRARGVPPEEVTADIQRRTAEQLFTVLGSLKGGAMKVGQALSVLEAALPEDLVEPYREMLVKLQDAAPPMTTDEVHEVLRRDLGAGWRTELPELEDRPVAAASIGQVHRGTWSDGRRVAVKAQYPGADRALRSDLQQIARLARVASTWMPGMDIKPVTEELLAVADEELDYGLEAASQRTFAQEYADDPDVAVPDVVHHSPHVLVSEWLDGVPLSQIIRDADQDVRDVVGRRLLTFLLTSPQRCGLMHGDPHPGNFRLTPDGRLGVVDYGSVARLPKGLPPAIGRILAVATDGDADAVLAEMRAEGFVLPGVDIDAQALLDYITPFVEPIRSGRHHFSRSWLRSASVGATDLRAPEFATGMRMNLPREYAMVHRVFLGATGVLSQLGSIIEVRELFEEHLPGFADA